MSGNHEIGRARLFTFLRRASAGEALTVGFLGGSITQGCLASKPEFGYADRMVKGLQKRFPRAHFDLVNAGVGGTGSLYGAIRMREDLLAHRPDLVVVDFSVNDAAAVLPMCGEISASGDSAGVADDMRESMEQPAVPYDETFEGVIRRILSAAQRPGVIVLNNAFYETGESTQDKHNRIADHYGIPHASARDEILPRIRSGEFTCGELSPDGLHPNDRGHELLAEILLGIIDRAMFAIGDSQVSETEILPDPLTDNAYEHMYRVDIRNGEPALFGFRADPVQKNGYWDFFRNGWTAAHVGDRMEIEAAGANIDVIYRKTVNRPSPVAELILDGDTEHPVILDGNFTEDWGDCLYLQPVLHHGKPGRHHMTVRITQATDADKAPFYLICFGAG
ncbi:MAG: SGNH/GDSL hydrolase family protein [Lachnospiraceae bacterium]|nr:SGNH/GDSL hydrolase family protein [Lachnospiraceae bacterium]